MSLPKVKIAVTLSPEIAEQLRAAVGSGRARSVSAFVEHAVRGQLAAEADFDELVEDMLAATGGPVLTSDPGDIKRLAPGAEVRRV